MRGSWGQDYFSDEFRGRLPPVSNNAQHLLLYVINAMENAHPNVTVKDLPPSPVPSLSKRRTETIFERGWGRDMHMKSVNTSIPKVAT